MIALLWLTILSPLVGAAAQLRWPARWIGVGAALLAAAGAGVGLLNWSAWSSTVMWLPRNGQPLLELGLRSDALSAGLLLSAFLTAALTPLTPRRLLQLAALSGALLAPDLGQAVLLGGLTVLLSPSSSRDADALSIAAGGLLLAGMISHTGSFSWSAPLLPDTPQAVLMVGTLAFAGLGLSGIAPWPPQRGFIRPVLGLGLLVQSRSLLSTATSIESAMAWLGALCIITAALGPRGLRGGLLGLILLALGAGSPTHAGLLLISTPPLLWMLERPGAPRQAAALTILAAPPAIGLATWAAIAERSAGRWGLLTAIGAGIFLLAAATPLSRPRSPLKLVGGLAPFVVLGLLGDGIAAQWGGRYALPMTPLTGGVVLVSAAGVLLSRRLPLHTIRPPAAATIRDVLWRWLVDPLRQAADAIERSPVASRPRWLMVGAAVLAALWLGVQGSAARPSLLPAAYSGTPWLLIGALCPAIGGLIGRWFPSAALLGALGPAVVTLRLFLGYDFQLGGLQFATPGVAVGVDSWGMLAMTLAAVLGPLVTWRARSTPDQHPALLLALTGLIIALISIDPALACVGFLLGVVGLRSASAVPLTAFPPLGLALILLVSVGLSADPTAQVRLFPVAFIGFGALAGLAPLHGSSAAVLRIASKPAAMLQAGLLAPIAILHLTRTVLLMPEGAAVWAQATTTLAAAAAIYGALIALESRSRREVAVGAQMTHAGLVGIGLTAFKLDAWSGVFMLALCSGAALVLWIDGEGSTKKSSEGAGLTLAGLSLCGAPGTPGFVAILLIAMGCWQSVWWASAWWTVAGLMATAVLAMAITRHLPAPPTRPHHRTWLLIGMLLFIGIWPRILLDPIEHSGAGQLREIVPALRQLMEGGLDVLVPESLRGWWL